MPLDTEFRHRQNYLREKKPENGCPEEGRSPGMDTKTADGVTAMFRLQAEGEVAEAPPFVRNH